MEKFDYYIFIDYSENMIGYTIIEFSKIKELLPKISRLRHYRGADNKKLYIKNVSDSFKRQKILSFLNKHKIIEIRENLEIFSDIAEFLKKNSNCLIFISVDDKQYSNFERLVKVVDGRNTKIVNESSLKENTMEYRISLILDNLLNIQRLKNNKK